MEGISRADEVEIEVDDPGSEAARFCLASYFDELEHRFEGGVDVSVSLDPDATTFTEPSGVFLVARLGDQPVGCTAMKFGPGERAMIKRMWVSGEMRGMGWGGSSWPRRSVPPPTGESAPFASRPTAP